MLSLIRKGEDALNVQFDRKVEIAMASSGSLNIAQYLGFEICEREHILQTAPTRRYIRTDLGSAVSRVVRDLSSKFHRPIRQFAALGPRTDTTCLELLKELPHTHDGFLPLLTLSDRRPSLAIGISSFVDGNWMQSLYSRHPEVADFIYFDESAVALVAEDPQLTFYLSNANFAQLENEAGKYIPQIRKRLTFVYSHVDAEWLEKIRIHLKPAVNDADLELWSDTRVQTTAKWADELQRVFDVSAAVIILVSADFLASEFALQQRLYSLLTIAHANGTTIIPLIVSPCLYRGSSLRGYLPHGSPDRPLTAMRDWEQGKTLLSLTEAILKLVKQESK